MNDFDLNLLEEAIAQLKDVPNLYGFIIHPALKFAVSEYLSKPDAGILPARFKIAYCLHIKQPVLACQTQADFESYLKVCGCWEEKEND